LSERPLSPEWGPMAWARLVQEHALTLFSSMFLVVGCMIDWITLFKALSMWKYACIIWLYVLELKSLVWINSWILVGWLFGYLREIVMLDKLWLVKETWSWYEFDIIPWNSWWDFMVVLDVMDVIPWISWWNFMVVS